MVDRAPEETGRNAVTFPRSGNADINSYFPDIMKEVREFKAIAVAENPEMELIYTAIEDVMDSSFIGTAKEYGLARFERIVKLTPKATDTLDERRFRALAKFNEDTPYTVKKLRELLNTLCGEDGYLLEINNNEFRLRVKVALKSKKNREAVEELTEKIAPVNMVISVQLMYNQHSMLRTLTHAQLAELTHFDIREEVIGIG